MPRAIDIRVIDLLHARLCHDLIGPVSAISNGAELLADEEPEFVKDAIALIGDSARKALRRLQFCRFAYGYGGGGLAGLAPHQLVAELFAESNVECDYGAAARELPLEQQKLACLLLALAGDALPRGGSLVLRTVPSGLEVVAAGPGAGPSPEIRAALATDTTSAGLTSRTVGGYFAGLLAEALGLRLEISDRPGGFRLAAMPR